jgi:ketosteroid isomerase-like protein
VNIILATLQAEWIDICLEEQVPLLVFFWGDTRPYVPDAHRRGIKVLLQVGSVAEAQAAAEAGVDGIIAQGLEAGGHVKSTTSCATRWSPPGKRQGVRPPGSVRGRGRSSERHPEATRRCRSCATRRHAEDSPRIHIRPGAVHGNGGAQKSMTKEDVADAVRAWCAAWHTRDIPTILAMEAQAGGFGFRPLVRRDHVARGEENYRQTLERFFGRMDDYRLELADFETSVTGEVGLAWGVYIETFQEKGHPPERARVRFSKVLTKRARGWQVLLYHRDI